MNPRLTISVCTYQSGDFDVMLIDKETKEEVCFSGNQKITDKQLDIVNRLAPACVWTTYYPSEQYKALQARCDELEANRNQVIQELIEKVGPNASVYSYNRYGGGAVDLEWDYDVADWLKAQMEGE